MSSSDSDSSSEDEAVLRALQSVAVSAEQLSAQQQVLAKQTKQRHSRQQHATGSNGAQQEHGGDNALPTGLDPVQTKIAALLDQRVSLMLESALEPEKKKKKRQKQDQQGAESTEAPGMDDDDLSGLRFFKRVPTGVPVRFPKAPEVVAPVIQQRQPGIFAYERILAGTRYEAASKGEEESCIPSLACEADGVASAAAARLKQLSEKPKPAASAAPAVAQEAKQAAAASPASEKGEQEEGKKKKKRKSKKKQKQDGVVIEETTPFVPHDERMVALLGH